MFLDAFEGAMREESINLSSSVGLIVNILIELTIVGVNITKGRKG